MIPEISVIRHPVANLRRNDAQNALNDMIPPDSLSVRRPGTLAGFEQVAVTSIQGGITLANGARFLLWGGDQINSLDIDQLPREQRDIVLPRFGACALDDQPEYALDQLGDELADHYGDEDLRVWHFLSGILVFSIRIHANLHAECKPQTVFLLEPAPCSAHEKLAAQASAQDLASAMIRHSSFQTICGGDYAISIQKDGI